MEIFLFIAVILLGFVSQKISDKNKTPINYPGRWVVSKKLFMLSQLIGHIFGWSTLLMSMLALGIFIFIVNGGKPTDAQLSRLGIMVGIYLCIVVLRSILLKKSQK